MSPSFAALRIRNFRWFSIGSLLNQSSFWMQRVAQDWLLLDMTDGSATSLGIATALQFLPYLLLTPFTGLLADRFSRRAVLIAAGSLAALSAAGMSIAAFTGHSDVGVIYTLAFVIGVAGAIDNPSRQSFIGDLVGRRFLVNAVALSSAVATVSRIAAPAVAGLVIAGLGTGEVFLLTSACLVLSIATLLAVRLSDLSSDAIAFERGATLRQGLEHLRERPTVVVVLVLVAVVATFGLNYQLTTSIMAVNEFGRGAAEFGLMGASVAIGSVIGALIAAGRSRTSLRLVVGAALVFAAVEFVTGLAPTFPVFLAMLPFSGFTAVTFVTSAQSFAQLHVDPAFRGRVMGIYTLMLFGGNPLGAPAIGLASDAFGPRTGLIAGGLLSAAGVLIALLVMRGRLRTAEPTARTSADPLVLGQA